MLLVMGVEKVDKGHRSSKHLINLKIVFSRESRFRMFLGFSSGSGRKKSRTPEVNSWREPHWSPLSIVIDQFSLIHPTAQEIVERKNWPLLFPVEIQILGSLFSGKTATLRELSQTSHQNISSISNISSRQLFFSYLFIVFMVGLSGYNNIIMMQMRNATTATGNKKNQPSTLSSLPRRAGNLGICVARLWERFIGYTRWLSIDNQRVGSKLEMSDETDIWIIKKSWKTVYIILLFFNVLFEK